MALQFPVTVTTIARAFILINPCLINGAYGGMQLDSGNCPALRPIVLTREHLEGR